MQLKCREWITQSGAAACIHGLFVVAPFPFLLVYLDERPSLGLILISPSVLWARRTMIEVHFN